VARETFLPGGLRKVVFFLLLSWLTIACSEAPTTTPAPPRLSPAIQTAAALQAPLTTGKPGAFPTGLPETAAPPATAVLTQGEIQGENPLVQVYRSRVQQLRYDPLEWEAVQVAEGVEPVAGAVYQLVSRSISGCILQENVTRGDPASWSRKVAKIPIGNLQYRQEMWTIKNTRQRVLAVYQYPAISHGKRFEVLMKEKPGDCILKAREVLSLSEDLIATP
jgi:hypothetical protein